MIERTSERGSTRNINKNTCKEKPSGNKDTGLNKKTYKCFLTVAIKLSRVQIPLRDCWNETVKTVEKLLKNNSRSKKPLCISSPNLHK